MSEVKDDIQAVATDRSHFVPGSESFEAAYGTQALADFLQVVGSGVADLNTIAVGLAAIGQDHKKPDELNISWAPKDPLVAARKARKAAVHAAMVVTVEGLGQYIRAITKLPRFERLTSEWALRKPKSPSAAERFSELATFLFSSATESADYCKRYRSCCVMLLIHWRNRHVHTDSNAELTHQEKQVIQAHEKEIHEAYAGLDVDQLLGDFKQNRPTLKDATTLIAMTIQEVRAIDEAVYICSSVGDLYAWLDHYKLTDRIDKIKRETTPEKQYASILRMLHTHAPHLKPWYEKLISNPPIES